TGRSTPPSGVVRYPRVEVGDVVVQRARWLVPTAQVPRRGRGEPDADHLLRLVAWLARSGIPCRCFVRAWRNDGDKLAKSRKPLYVDFANWFLAMGFEHQVGTSEHVLFEEALPAPEDAVGGDPNDPNDPTDPSVTELVIEISD